MGLPPVVLIALYATVALAPLGLAAWSGPRERDFQAELGIGLGLIAYAMLLLQLISSGRFGTLSGHVGIDRTMRFHQLTARLVALLVILHPLVPRLSADPQALAQTPRMTWIMFTLPNMRSGAIAWLVLLLLVAMAVWRHRLPIRYEGWRVAHALGAMVVAGAGAHHALTVGSYSQQPFLLWFWCALLALALTSFLYVYLVRPWRSWRLGYRVTANRELAPGIRELTLEPAPGRSIRFEPGQFAWVNFRSLPPYDHPFSFCSAPGDLPRVRMLVKARGDFSGNLGKVAVGTPARLDAPHGNFGLRGLPADAIYLIAGGIGISPIMSVLRHLHAARDPRPISLLYGARNPRQLVYADEIQAMTADLRLQLRLFVDEPPPGWTGGSGEMTGEAIRAGLPLDDPSRCLCLTCGPTPMMLAAEHELIAVGVPANQIVYERFEFD